MVIQQRAFLVAQDERTLDELKETIKKDKQKIEEKRQERLEVRKLR